MPSLGVAPTTLAT